MVAARLTAGGSTAPAHASSASPVPATSLLAQLVPARLRWLMGALFIFGAASYVVNQQTMADVVFTVRSPNNVFITGFLAMDVSAPATQWVGFADMLAGDTVVAPVEIRNTGNVPANGLTLTTIAEESSNLTSDTINGLQLVIDRCSAPWSGEVPFTCAGTVTPNVLIGPIMQTNAPLLTTALQPNASDYLRIAITLAPSADNTFQAKSAAVAFRWDLSQ